MRDYLPIVIHAIAITSFVFIMMVVIEYVNVLSRGAWLARLARSQWGQYVVAVVLGATPGCLGAFAVVAAYAHGSLSLGAVVAAMIATSGDEAFVMFAMIPREAFILMALLAAIGAVAGWATDLLLPRRAIPAERCCPELQVHGTECNCFPRGSLLTQWRHCSIMRAILAGVFVLLLIAVALGVFGPDRWNWIRLTFVISTAVAVFIVSTVPDHFLEEHLWHHVMRRHVPGVFAWTFGALLVMHLLLQQFGMEHWLDTGRWYVLATACVVGLIPESGPHLVFVTLYAEGAIPLSILLASSIVQDGHGILPMLAHSRRDFLLIKGINLLVGLLVGAVALSLGL